MENNCFLDESKKNIDSELKELLEKLKTFVGKYDLIPVLERTYINDNFIFEKKNGTPNDDPFLSNYVADLYLSFQKNKKLLSPNRYQITKIIQCCKEIYDSVMIKEILENTDDFNRLTLKFTERAIYISIIYKICNNLIEEKYLTLFKKKTGFSLKMIFIFHHVISLNLLNKLDSKKTKFRVPLYFSLDEIYKDILIIDNSITIEELHNFIEYFLITETNNSNYLPRFDFEINPKPVFKHNEKYICYNPLALIKNVIPIFETALKDNSKILSEYGNSKGHRLELMGINILTKLFPDAIIYNGLTFIVGDENHEIDILVDTGNYLLIVESKARNFRKKGIYNNDLNNYKNSIRNTIEKAQNQCKIDYEYILKNDSAEFKNKDETVLIKKHNYIDIFMFTIEQDNLETITSDVFETLSIFQSNPILTFSIYDLLIIQEVIKKGAIFLIYLEQRRNCLKEGNTHSHDELDYLSLFLDQDIEFSNEKYTDIDITNYSDVLDKYFFENKTLPKWETVPGIETLICMVKKINPKAAVTFETFLLSLNINRQREFISKLDYCKENAIKNIYSNFCSVAIKELNIGLTFLCSKNIISEMPEQNLKLYALQKAREQNIKYWFYILITLEPYAVQYFDIAILD